MVKTMLTVQLVKVKRMRMSFLRAEMVLDKVCRVYLPLHCVHGWGYERSGNRDRHNLINQKRIQVMIGHFLELCKRSSMKVNGKKNKVMLLGIYLIVKAYHFD